MSAECIERFGVVKLNLSCDIDDDALRDMQRLYFYIAAFFGEKEMATKKKKSAKRTTKRKATKKKATKRRK